jgi:hypothetical protein
VKITTWFIPMHSPAHKDSKEIYFVFFGHFYKFLLIFKVGNDFY